MNIVLGGKKGGIIGSIIVIILGVGLILGAYLYQRSTTEKSDGWIHTVATVVDYEQRRDYDSDGNLDYMYREIIEYVVNGITYRKTSNVSSNIRPSIGSTREIAYNPNNPNDCIFVSANNMMCIVFYAVGALFAAVGVFAFVYTLIKYGGKRESE